MKKRFNILTVFLISGTLSAQTIDYSEGYFFNPITINPAYAGGRGALNVSFLYDQQWTGITGAPETVALSADAPLLNSRLGLGLNIIRDKYAVTKETAFKTSYAYRLDLGGDILSLGLGAGLITTNTKWSDLVVIDPGDDLYLTDSKVFALPDFSFGMYYSVKNYFAGFSIPNLIDYDFDYNKNKYALKVNPGDYYYLLYTGNIFEIAPKMKFLPSVLLAVPPGKKIQYDLHAQLGFADKLWCGLSYLNGRSVAGHLRVQLNEQLTFGYRYKFEISQLRTYNNGSHEVMIRYEFKYRVDVIDPLEF
jgi:type IX secretion system PorP/SprF family membrane protein